MLYKLSVVNCFVGGLLLVDRAEFEKEMEGAEDDKNTS